MLELCTGPAYAMSIRSGEYEIDGKPEVEPRILPNNLCAFNPINVTLKVGLEQMMGIVADKALFTGVVMRALCPYNRHRKFFQGV